jgi:GTPase SAR1 family protein
MKYIISKVRATEDVPIILVANKVDLEQTQRRVSSSEGMSLANKFGCSFLETSAAHRRHVDDVFHTLVREIRKHDEKDDNKEGETSKWKKVWNNIFKNIKKGRKQDYLIKEKLYKEKKDKSRGVLFGSDKDGKIIEG